jgi:molybdate transport system ATP-binding protein
MSIAVAIRHRQGDFSLDVHFEAEARVVALFGPSGSGKTSVLNVIAGLIRPKGARVVVQDNVLTDTRSGIFVPVHKRRIGYVFQEGRLFPHLTVRRNLGYGRWFTPKGEHWAKLEEVVALLGITDLLDRKPSTLSGGEKQRVSIGRALLASPRILLMDEPLASLDEERKRETLPYIERLRDELLIPIVYVSHSLAEVQRLTGHIVHLDAGRVRHRGGHNELLMFASGQQRQSATDTDRG